jgi:signal transduction histidine kinase
MSTPEFARLVTLACHDLRTPLATVNGFAKALLRGGDLAEPNARYVELIDEAARELADLLDLLGLAVRIETGTYEPAMIEADTLELARSDEQGHDAVGTGETIEADVPSVSRALSARAGAALRHGGVERVTWTVEGRTLELAPVTEAAARVVTGEDPKDLGSLVASKVIEQAGGELELDGETLRVRL